MEKIKIVFIGGLTNGKIVYDYLNNNKFVDVVYTITYPNAAKRARQVDFPDGSTIRKSFSANEFKNEIVNLNPDFIFVAGWSELLDEDIVKSAKFGTIGFHPSKLPYDRGRSVLAWQIEEGYQTTALTMFYYNDIPDGGEIIGQDIIKIEKNDYISDILDKVDFSTKNLMRAYFPLLRIGNAPKIKQSLEEGNFRRLRDENDSLINWDTNDIIIYNKIRAISKPYPGAVAIIDKLKYKIFEAELIDDFPFSFKANIGQKVADIFDGSMIIKCKNGFIKIQKYELYE